MKVVIFAATMIVALVPTVRVHSQVVCQVIEEIGCPLISGMNCPDLGGCIPVPGNSNDECTSKAVRETPPNPNPPTRYGIRPANPGEPGFVYANHVGTNYCYQERVCHKDCVDVGENLVIWKCQ